MGASKASESHNGDDTTASVGPPTTSAGSATEKGSTLNGEPEDAGNPASKRRKPLSFFLAFSCLMIMVLLCSMDSTIMAVSIPTITEDLGGTTFEAFWASLAYTLSVVITLPIYASSSDVLGRMLPLYSSFALFLVGSIVFATAKSMKVVIIGRLIQGLGGGGLDGLNEIIMVDITTLKERPLYLGILAIPMALGSIVGPIIGSAFTEYATWRWIGWINLPLLALDAFLAAFFLRLKSLDEPLDSRFARLDWTGSLMYAVGATAFALPLSWGDQIYAWSSWRTIVPLIIGIIVLIALGFYEKRPHSPLFPHRLFKSRTSLITLLNGAIHGLIIYPATTYVPLFFQAVKLQTPLESAVSMLPSCCGVIGFALLSGVAVDISRRYTWQFQVSWISIAVGVGIWSLWDKDTSVAETAGFQLIAGVGLGALWTVPSLSMQAGVATVQDQALSVGLLVGTRLFGALIGLAIGSTVFASVFQKAIAPLQPLPQAAAILRDASQAVGFIPSLRGLDVTAEELAGIIKAYRESFQVIWYAMAAFGCVGFVTSFLIKEKSIESEEKGNQHRES